MAIVLSSGATLAPSPQTGAWVVSSLYGVTVSAEEHPKAALLLLEEQPTKELVAQLAGFPLQGLLDHALASGSSRYKAHARRWILQLVTL